MGKRIIETEIDGKKYPLNFSIKAGVLFAERYGSVEDTWESISKKTQTEQLREICWMLQTLIEQGFAYQKIFEEEQNQIPEKIPTAEDLEIMMGFMEFYRMQDEIQKAMLAGISPEVQVELKKKAKEKTEEVVKSTQKDISGASITG